MYRYETDGAFGCVTHAHRKDGTCIPDPTVAIRKRKGRAKAKAGRAMRKKQRLKARRRRFQQRVAAESLRDKLRGCGRLPRPYRSVEDRHERKTAKASARDYNHLRCNTPRVPKPSVRRGLPRDAFRLWPSTNPQPS